MQPTLKNTAQVVDLMTSSRAPRIYQRIDELHLENLAQIRAAGEEDGKNNIPDLNSLQSSDNERRIPISYQQLVLEESLALKVIQASLRTVESSKQKVMEREAIFQIEQEISQIKSRLHDEQKKERRLIINANKFMLENPLLVNLIFVLLLVGETYLNNNAMRFFGVPLEASAIMSLIITAALLVFVKRIGVTTKRSQHPDRKPNYSIVFGMLYLMGIIFLSYCRCYFLINGEDLTGDVTNAAEQSNDLLSKLDWSVFTNFNFIMTLLFHLILGGLSFLIGYESVDSSESYQEAYLDSLRIKDLELKHRKLTDYDHRVQDESRLDKMRAELDEVRRQIDGIEKILSEINAYIAKKVEDAVLEYRVHNMRGRPINSPIPLSFAMSPIDAEA